METKKITKIVVQKKRKNRCSIFLDEEFGFGLHQDIVLKYKLKKGDVLTTDQIEDILISEEKNKAKERAIKFLSYRDRSEKEMVTKLHQIGYDESIIDFVINDLKRAGLIDDERFARSYAQTKMITRPMGEYLLVRELKQKGVDEDLIDQTIESTYQEKDQQQIALELAQKKKKQLKNVEETKARKRVADFLLRRGFDWGIISDLFDRWDEI